MISASNGATKRTKKSLFGVISKKGSNKHYLKLAIISANVVFFGAVSYLVVQAQSSPSTEPKHSSPSLLASNDAEDSVKPLDELSSADIAVNIARVTDLPEATMVKNQADTINAGLAVASTDDKVVAKPQIISKGLKSKADIIHYKVKKGDTVKSLAEKFGISAETIRLSNNIAGNDLTVGMDLLISPVDGVIYRVKDGDTPNSVASKFRADAQDVIAFNDVELTRKLKAGSLIVVPDGREVQPRDTFTVSRGLNPGASLSFSFDGSGNGYAFGWCTYYAAARSGAPDGWGNASTWAYYAGLTPGWTVSSIPKKGAIAQTNANHVGIVEDVRVVNGQYQIKYSDMNGIAGFNRVGYSGWVSSQSPFQNYIYRR